MKTSKAIDVYDHPWKVKIVDSVTSTMDALKDTLENVSSEKYLAVIARHQEAGKGRRGRSWQSEEGNLFLSFSLPFLQDLSRCFEVAFSCALALDETIRFFFPEAFLTLKWPNDILLNGKKLSGILIESFCRGEDPLLIIGVGVNLAVSPDLHQNNSSSIKYEGIALKEVMSAEAVPSPKVFTEHFLPSFNFYEAKRKALGFSYIREKWLERTFDKGTILTVSSECASITGPFFDLDDQGRLLIGESEETAAQFLSGDVLINSKGKRELIFPRDALNRE